MTSLVSQEQQERSSGLPTGPLSWDETFPHCARHVTEALWEKIKGHSPKVSLELFLEGLKKFPSEDESGFLPDLARLEWALYTLSHVQTQIPSQVNSPTLNPTLQILEMSWANLPQLVNLSEGRSEPLPEPGEEIVLAWKSPVSGKVLIKKASPEDLLVLKMVVEAIDKKDIAAMGDLPLGAVDAAMARSISKGLVIAPKSKIRRDPPIFSTEEGVEQPFVSPSVFTLQWHITQACDLHCKHCYDRSKRSPLTVDQGLRILDDLRTFCEEHHVRGQVSFTGGNPLMYPHFKTLYRAAVEKGLAVAILGNPCSEETMEAILAIERPVFFQVSLEGLEAHNDMIRGTGHFKRVLDFLDVLRNLRISSKVMLTLTKANMDQVLPLAELLRDRTDDFTFNRLSMVGEGANLQPPDKKDFPAFLKSYVEASRHNPTMGWKDNFINIVCHQDHADNFGGCTGYGCGAAFNFMAVLSDGEAHACRKFPSPIGNVYQKSISDIYEGKEAEKYRSGPKACRSCPLHLVCRGCLAVAYSHGLDIFTEQDPYCFMPGVPS